MLQEQETYAGLTIVQWVMVAGALLLYCGVVQFEFFFGESLQSAYLVKELSAPRSLQMIDNQPIGVRALLGSVPIQASSDVVFSAIAFLQSAVTLVFATLFFSRSLRPEVSVAGGILLTHYTWAGPFALLPFSWVGPLFALFCYALVKPKNPWILALSQVLSGLVCPPLLLLTIPILICWFLGEAIGRANRPKLVRSTLNIGPVLRWKPWAIIGVSLLIASAISVGTLNPIGLNWTGLLPPLFDPQTPWVTYTGNYTGANRMIKMILAFPLAIYVLVLGGVALGLIQKAGLTRIAFFLLAVFIGLGVYSFSLNGYREEALVGYAAEAYGIMTFLPICVALVVGFADFYFSKWYVSVAAVIFLLLWIPAYSPVYLT
ncbi:hypothetical protein [Lewinella sp. 4G2]|uniref:hypothetical protein n=1 Tax=Lewinella sp. 4G2 TaxID=1803372 RepID=UPI0007B47D43|nr:hypothetical protein [Lewinella sp. 4G2]OAV43058.1 hypothetical protein A3850_000440 [Lewinella sp. 4G2]